MADEKIQELRRDHNEDSRSYAKRLLASMFQEVYRHTNREMPSEMFDRCSELVDEIRWSTEE